MHVFVLPNRVATCHGKEDHGDLFCDLEHNPHKVDRSTSNGKCVGLLSHGLYWSDRHKRPLVQRELLWLEGFALRGSDYGATFEARDLSLAQITDLAGNGMHMEVVVLVK